MPTDWQPTEAHRSFAGKHGLDVELEATGFRGHFEGKKVLSWDGRFTTWLANQAKWNKQRGNGGGRNGAPVLQRGGFFREQDRGWLEKPGPVQQSHGATGHENAIIVRPGGAE